MSSSASTVAFLDLYEPLDVIGNGSFGIIRKVRRKSDGMVFARKELNFERMNERDRKQIVAEVNILKDLHHDHIVRYHDRYVDREAGILYILMEYCGGGDLSTVIKQALKQDRLIPEDTVWSYFMQILLALQHCHHPNGHGRSGSTGSASGGHEGEGKERRAQILHRDLKPDNVFLDENNTVKLGDFGLSKALSQASFANTYVGTPYYMSPELMQEKAYDNKSDIWSLGCLMYEMCALKPPFHEAKTHSELSILIRNGRIPPLPKLYSQSLVATIKSMLNLNPAMRPSVAQLLQHERLELVFKVAETDKMLQTVKAHKTNLLTREREILAREAALQEKDTHLTVLLAQKDQEILSLQRMVSQFQQQSRGHQDLQAQIEQAVARREEELRLLVAKREEEVALAMTRREEEIIASVNQREVALSEAWAAREQQIREEVDSRVQWVLQREAELNEESETLQTAKAQLEERVKKWEERGIKGRRDKAPLEEVKNILEPCLPRTSSDRSTPQQRCPSPFPPFATPASRHGNQLQNFPSAMKGVVMTNTGELLATPAPGELAKLFVESPKVGLNFTKIFEFASEEPLSDNDEDPSPPPSPTSRKDMKSCDIKENSNPAPPTRIRRPSIRTSRSSTLEKLPSSFSDPGSLSQPSPTVKPLPHPHLHHASTAPATLRPSQRNQNGPEYDLQDEENLPSPFLKRAERAATVNKRPSNGNLLRAVAAANNIGRRGTTSKSNPGPDEHPTPTSSRSSVASKKGGEVKKSQERVTT